MSAEQDLLPCPFCGGEASIFPNFTIKVAFVVECDECKSASAYFKTAAEAIAAWNRRPTPSPARAEQDLAEAVLRLDANSQRDKSGNRVFVDARDWEILLADARKSPTPSQRPGHVSEFDNLEDMLDAIAKAEDRT